MGEIKDYNKSKAYDGGAIVRKTCLIISAFLTFIFFFQGVALSANGAEALYQNGQELARTFHNAEAINSFTKAIELDQNLIDAHISRGYIYLEQAEYDNALFDFITAMRINPQSPEANANIALLYAFRGRYDQSLDIYQKVLSMVNWTNIIPLINAIECEKSSRKMDAIASYNRFLSMNMDRFIWRVEIIFAERRINELKRID